MIQKKVQKNTMQYAYQLDHQDWKEVVFTKKRPADNAARKAVSQLEPEHKRALKEDTDGFQNKMFDKEYIQEVIRKRTERGWNQKQLAVQMNVDVNLLQRFEQGKEVYDSNLKNKLNRVLGITRK